MLRHIVWWTLKPTAEGRTAAENAQWIKEYGEALLGKIPSLKTIEISYIFAETITVPVGVLLHSTHEDEAGLLAYAQHAEHQAYGEIVKKVTSSRQAIDFFVTLEP